METFRKSTGAVAGAGAGIFAAANILAGANSPPVLMDMITLVSVLAVSGMSLGTLLQHLLARAGSDDSVKGSLLPWLAVLIVPVSFLTPTLNREGSQMGNLKHFISAAWILGSLVYGAFFVKPLLKRRRSAEIAAGCSIVLLLMSASFSTYAPRESDEGDYVAQAIALVETGTTLLPPIIDNGSFESFYFGTLPPAWGYYEFIYVYRKDIFSESLRSRSMRMIGYPILLAPFIAAARVTAVEPARWFISGLPGIAAYFILIYSVSALSILRAGAGTAADYATISIAMLTPFLHFAANLQPEIWMAAGVGMTLLLTHLHVCARRDNSFLLGFATFIPVCFHERMIIISALWTVMLMILGRRRLMILAGCIAALIPSLFSFALIHDFRMPTTLPHAYGDPREHFLDLERWMRALYQHIFSIRIGILTHLPIIWLLPIHYLSRAARKIDGTAAVALAVAAGYFAIIITYPHTFDSYPHLRYLVPILPLLGIFMIDACRGLCAVGKFRLIETLLVLQILRAYPFLVLPSLWRVISLR